VYLVYRFVRIQPFSRAYARLIVPAAACLAAMIGANLLLSDAGWLVHVVGVAAAGGIVYLPVLLLFGLTKGEEVIIKSLLGRPVGGEELRIRPTRDEDRAWIDAVLEQHWGGPVQVVNGRSFRPAELPALVALEDDERVGYAPYRVVGDTCELALLQSLHEGHGVGTALVRAVVEEASARGCRRLTVVTTNDNVHAKDFYEMLGFRVTQVREGDVDRARELKPSIPAVGEGGVGIHDEIELELDLEPERTRPGA
jgi:ribosomal protein S18 acetylase RimI-like enzyme